MYRSHVLICGGTGCTSSNSEKIIEKMKEEIKARGLENEVNKGIDRFLRSRRMTTSKARGLI